MRECLNVLMLEWLARSNHSSNQAIRQSSNLFNLSTDNEKCGSIFQLSNNQTFKQSKRFCFVVAPLPEAAPECGKCKSSASLGEGAVTLFFEKKVAV